jgi:uncharacterized protein
VGQPQLIDKERTMSDCKLKVEIIEDMKTAMRAQDKAKLQAIRLITAALKQKEVDERVELTDTDVLAILDKMIKQRRDSIKQYELAKRDDLVAQEAFEIKVIEAYLPESLSEAELTALIQDVIKQTQAQGMQDMGKVMGLLKPKVQGRADMGMVSQKIKDLLQQK